MSNIARLAVLVTALASLIAVASSSAGAVTWTNTGNTAVHATGTGGRVHVNGITLVCTATTATGAAPVGGTSTYSVTGTILFTPCTLAGQPGLVSCSYTFSAIGHSGGIFGGLTTGTFALNCRSALEVASATTLCHVTGAVPGSYTNPGAAGGLGNITLNTTTTLAVTNGAANCPLGMGTGTLTHESLTTTFNATPIISTD